MEEKDLRYKNPGQGKRQKRIKRSEVRSVRSVLTAQVSVTSLALCWPSPPLGISYTLGIRGHRTGMTKDLGPLLLSSTLGPACFTIYLSSKL